MGFDIRYTMCGCGAPGAALMHGSVEKAKASVSMRRPDSLAYPPSLFETRATYLLRLLQTIPSPIIPTSNNQLASTLAVPDGAKQPSPVGAGGTVDSGEGVAKTAGVNATAVGVGVSVGGVDVEVAVGSRVSEWQVWKLATEQE